MWAGLVMLAVLSALPVFGNTIPVTNTADSGPGSLRDAIATAASGHTNTPNSFYVAGLITTVRNTTVSAGQFSIPFQITVQRK